MYVPMAQAATIGDQLLQGLNTARTTDPTVLLIMAFMGLIFLAVVFMLTRWRDAGSNIQVNSSLLKVIDDLREERKEQEKRQDEKDVLHRQTILQITTAHQNETEKQNVAMNMQLDVLTGMFGTSQTIQTEIEEITKTVVGINPETRLIADSVHAETRKVIIDAIKAMVKDLNTQVDSLREAIKDANESTYQVFSEDGSLTQILVSLQSILTILRTQERNINETSISNLVSGNVAADNNGYNLSAGNSGSQPGSVSDEHTSGSTDGSTTVNGSGSHPDSGSDASRDTSTDTLTSR